MFLLAVNVATQRILIIGAGPAGCIAAIALIRAGFDVTLIEQHRFPRDKVCGECLSRLGIAVLQSLKLDEVIFETVSPVELRRSVFFTSDGGRLEVKLPAYMWGISRKMMDSILLDHARQSCTVLQPARCEKIDSNAMDCTVTVRDLTSNRASTLAGDWVLLADGKNALTHAKPPSTGDFGVKSHWSDVDAPRDAIELFGVNGHYGGIAPIEGGRFNLSFSIPAARINACRGDLDALFADVSQENVELARQLRRARRVGAWQASPLPRFGVSVNWPRRVIPLGNAAAAVEPIGGEGMGLAMRSAQLVADELIAARNDRRDINTDLLRRQFRSLWNPRRIACRLAAGVISRPAVAAPALELLNFAPTLTAGVMKWIGK